MVSIILWHNVLFKQAQSIGLIQSHFSGGVSVGIVFGVLAEIGQVPIIHWHTELHTNLRERCHCFHRLDAVGNADITLAINEIQLIDNHLQMTCTIIILYRSLSSHRMVIQSLKMQARALGNQILQARLLPTRQGPRIHLVVQCRCTPKII